MPLSIRPAADSRGPREVRGSRAARRHACAVAALCGTLWLPSGVAGQPPASGTAGSAAHSERMLPSLDAAQWVERMRRDPCTRTYSGTLVVSSAAGAMSSSRLWHACAAGQPVVRVEPLSGLPRIVFRQGDEVRTFNLQTRTVRIEPHEPAHGLPAMPVLPGAAVSQYYTVKPLGSERVAGAMADGIAFIPQDAWRFGYRFWIERDSGLVIKLQTVGPQARVLEQTAFSQLDLQTPVQADELLRSVPALQGYQIEKNRIRRTTAQAEGWGVRQVPPGFVALGCFQRPASAAAAQGAPVLQCVYSDGLASVSVFVEAAAAPRADKPQTGSVGATHLWGQQLDEQTWITVVGEVPVATLRAFAQQFERLR